jgi:hypothetical protein
VAHGRIIACYYNYKCEILKQNTLNTNIDIYLIFKDIKKVAPPELESTFINSKAVSIVRNAVKRKCELY